MCVFGGKTPKVQSPAVQRVAAYDNEEASQRGDIEARLRRRRRGAAANVLTSPSGIPATATLGGTAA